ncbi:hypothetical protein [Nonomuraea sp. NPDC050643]|uniref:hypothetical protein n=1 Tax=Nonomuraea sp. NPDC050643 TaxID=3155660 RepID=UPI0033EC4B56
MSDDRIKDELALLAELRSSLDNIKELSLWDEREKRLVPQVNLLPAFQRHRVWEEFLRKYRQLRAGQIAREAEAANEDDKVEQSRRRWAQEENDRIERQRRADAAAMRPVDPSPRSQELNRINRDIDRLQSERYSSGRGFDFESEQ